MGVELIELESETFAVASGPKPLRASLRLVRLVESFRAWSDSTSRYSSCRRLRDYRDSLSVACSCKEVIAIRITRFATLEIDSHSHAVFFAQSADRADSPFRICSNLPSRARAHGMENLNLIYNDYQLIICIEHGYCVASCSLKYHLTTVHKVKGDILRAALAEANALNTRDPPTGPTSCRRPRHLTSYHRLRVLLRSICMKAFTPSMSKSKRMVEKHLRKEHAIDHAKGKTKPTASSIEEA